MIGRQIDSRYLILEQLGEGGMGKVYKARHLDTEEIVAIKFLQWTTMQIDKERFFREAKILASLGHPNIGKFYGFGEIVGEEPYIVMEFYGGPRGPGH